MPNQVFVDRVETGDLSAWTSTTTGGSGVIAADTGQVHAGTYAIKGTLTSTADNANAYALGALDDAGRGVSSWVYLSALPSANCPIFVASTNVGVRVIVIGLVPGGNLFAANASVTSYKIGATALATSTWYRISFSYLLTSTSSFTVNVYINGVLELTYSNADGTLDGTGTNALFIGPSGGGAMSVWYDDVYVDNRTDLGDTSLPPPALGLTHRPFAFTPGAGGQGLRR